MLRSPFLLLAIALGAVIRGLNEALPGIEITAPRDATGAVSITLLPEERRRSFRGLLGHYHVSGAKTDPGPAFDWERILREARSPRAEPLTRRRSTPVRVSSPERRL